MTLTVLEELTNAPSLGRGFLTNSTLPGPARCQMPDKCQGKGEGGGGGGWALLVLTEPVTILSGV